jgi:hypothetical protein
MLENIAYTVRTTERRKKNQGKEKVTTLNIFTKGGK